MIAGTIEIEGKRFVVLPQGEYEQLMNRRASGEDSDLPPLPKPLRNGNFDAVAFSRASLARRLILDRRASGLSQAELARRAGVRVETLNRIERCKLSPSVATVDKLDRAMKRDSRRPPKEDRIFGQLAQKELKAFRKSHGKGTPWPKVKRELGL